jgi:hypothetical protein
MQTNFSSYWNSIGHDCFDLVATVELSQQENLKHHRYGEHSGGQQTP